MSSIISGDPASGVYTPQTSRSISSLSTFVFLFFLSSITSTAWTSPFFHLSYSSIVNQSLMIFLAFFLSSTTPLSKALMKKKRSALFSETVSYPIRLGFFFFFLLLFSFLLSTSFSVHFFPFSPVSCSPILGGLRQPSVFSPFAQQSSLVSSRALPANFPSILFQSEIGREDSLSPNKRSLFGAAHRGRRLFSLPSSPLSSVFMEKLRQQPLPESILRRKSDEKIAFRTSRGKAKKKRSRLRATSRHTRSRSSSYSPLLPLCFQCMYTSTQTKNDEPLGCMYTALPPPPPFRHNKDYEEVECTYTRSTLRRRRRRRQTSTACHSALLSNPSYEDLSGLLRGLFFSSLFFLLSPRSRKKQTPHKDRRKKSSLSSHSPLHSLLPREFTERRLFSRKQRHGEAARIPSLRIPSYLVSVNDKNKELRRQKREKGRLFSSYSSFSLQAARRRRRGREDGFTSLGVLREECGNRHASKAFTLNHLMMSPCFLSPFSTTFSPLPRRPFSSSFSSHTKLSASSSSALPVSSFSSTSSLLRSFSPPLSSPPFSCFLSPSSSFSFSSLLSPSLSPRSASLSVSSSLRAKKLPFLSSSLPADDERGAVEESAFFDTSLEEDLDAMNRPRMPSSSDTARRREGREDIEEEDLSLLVDDNDEESLIGREIYSTDSEDTFPARRGEHPSGDRQEEAQDLLLSDVSSSLSRRKSEPTGRRLLKKDTGDDSRLSSSSLLMNETWGDEDEKSLSLSSQRDRRRRRRRSRDLYGERRGGAADLSEVVDDPEEDRVIIGEVEPTTVLPEDVYSHQMKLPPLRRLGDQPDDPLPFPADFISEEEKQDIRRMPTKEERLQDKRDYFGADNVRAYHMYNPHWTPYQESNYRPSHDFEASAVGHFGQSPQRPIREGDVVRQYASLSI